MSKGVPWAGFMSPRFTHMPGESYCTWFIFPVLLAWRLWNAKKKSNSFLFAKSTKQCEILSKPKLTWSLPEQHRWGGFAQTNVVLGSHPEVILLARPQPHQVVVGGGDVPGHGPPLCQRGLLGLNAVCHWRVVCDAGRDVHRSPWQPHRVWVHAGDVRGLTEHLGWTCKKPRVCFTIKN